MEGCERGIMGRLVNESHWLYRFLTRVADWMILSILWCICSLPVITIGVSTSALYFVSLKLVRGEEPAVIKSFFQSFRINFRQGIALGLLVASALLAIAVDYYIYRVADGIIRGLFAGVCMLSAGVLVLVLPYLFPLQAQFNNTVWQMCKNAFLIAIANLPTTIILLIIHVIPVIIGLISWELFIRLVLVFWAFGPAGIAYLCSRRINRIFEPLMDTREVTDTETVDLDS